MSPSFSKAALLPFSLILSLTTASPLYHTRASALVPPTTTIPPIPSTPSTTPSPLSNPILAQRDAPDFTTLTTTVSTITVSESTSLASISSAPLFSADAHPTSRHLDPTIVATTTQTAPLEELQKRGNPKHTSTASPPPTTTPPPPPSPTPAPITTTPTNPAATDGPLFTIPDPTPTATPSSDPNVDVKGGIEIIPLGTNTVEKREEPKATATPTVTNAGSRVVKGDGGSKALVKGGDMVPKGTPGS